MRPGFCKLVRVLTAAACVGLLAAGLAALMDLRAFEYAPLYRLLGPGGVAFLLGILAGVVVLLTWAVRGTRDATPPTRWAAGAILFGSALLALWALEWMFIETPPTVRLERLWMAERPVTVSESAKGDFDSFSVVRGAPDPAAREPLAVMYERIRLVNPEVNERHPIGKTIDAYAAALDVDPKLLFYLAYVHSFWGEAVSGRAPFLQAMTAETIRDVVQIHLPAWFVESSLRRHLAESDRLERLAGPGLGFKLRYAFHKATLDVSAQPYELNTFSDVMLVLQEYPERFQDVLGPDVTDPVRRALRDSFLKLSPAALQKPYEFPYSVPQRDASYYDANRRDLKTFARAAYYATVLDFDLATRLAASLVDYQRRVYIAALGQESWDSLSPEQSAAILGMTRDAYVPNVGRPAYNLYALPEMNCTPVEFVAREAVADRAALLAPDRSVWRPREYELLWGGAGTKLRVLSEVWAAATGDPFTGLEPESTVDTSRLTVLQQPPP